MSDRRLVTAALNNARWCAAVWAAHGLPVRRPDGMWFTPVRTPQYYPNVVTVDPLADRRAQVALIAELAAQSAGFSVKDSFAALDLSVCGLEPLFSAHWLWCDAPALSPRAGQLAWRRVDDAAGLELWEQAWRGGPANLPRIFLPELLADQRVRVLAGVDAVGEMKAGGVGYDADGAMGISNIFGAPEDFLAAVMRLTAPRRIVGYEQAAARRALEKQGFEVLGELRVWRHSA